MSSSKVQGFPTEGADPVMVVVSPTRRFVALADIVTQTRFAGGVHEALTSSIRAERRFLVFRDM